MGCVAEDGQCTGQDWRCDMEVHAGTPLEPVAARTAGPLISQQDTRRDVCAWDAFALDEKVCFTALRSLKKYDPGTQCGIEYNIMYCKIARMQKFEFLIFGIFVVQGKKCLYII